MISNQLMEEIISLSSNNLLIDKELIVRIVLEQIEHSDYITQDIFSNIVFERIYEKDIMGLCNSFEGIITIDLKKIYKYYKKNNNTLYVNLQIVRNVLHEIEHLKEKYKSNKDDTVKLLINLSNPDIMYDLYKNKFLTQNMKNKKVDKLYFKIYNFIPSERIADIDSSNILLKSVKNYPKKLDIYYRLKEEYINDLFSGYVKVLKNNMYNIPLVDYLKKIKKEIYLNDFDFYSKDYIEFYNLSNNIYNIEEKMRFGLPITLEEAKNINIRK